MLEFKKEDFHYQPNENLHLIKKINFVKGG